MLRYNNINVRVFALIYIRLSIDYIDLFACMNGSFADKKIMNGGITVG
jgi:hypothetical protein